MDSRKITGWSEAWLLNLVIVVNFGKFWVMRWTIENEELPLSLYFEVKARYEKKMKKDVKRCKWIAGKLRDEAKLDYSTTLMAKSYLDVDSTAFSAVLEKQKTLDEELGKEEQLAKREIEAQQLLHWQLFQMRHAEPGTAAYTQLIPQTAALQKYWSECTQEKQKIQETTTALKAELAVAKVHLLATWCIYWQPCQ